VRGGVAEAGRAATAVLSKVTGLTIEHWMAIDFTGFKAAVDTVGGVTIDNPVAFEYTWSEPKYHAAIWDGGSFPAGVIMLDGEAALDYARNRYTSVLAESSDFARLAQVRLAGADGIASRGVKQAPFVVLLGVQMPSALVEIGFLTNPEDERRLATAARRERIAASLAQAVLEFGRRYDARRGADGERSALPKPEEDR